MSLHDILREARTLGFTKTERHDVGNVYREAIEKVFTREYHDRTRYGELIARQYIRNEIDKWQRKGYVLIGERHVHPDLVR